MWAKRHRLKEEKRELGEKRGIYEDLKNAFFDVFPFTLHVLYARYITEQEVS